MCFLHFTVRQMAKTSQPLIQMYLIWVIIEVISSTLNESGDFFIQEFEVKIMKAGMYYLAAWIKGSL